MESLQVQVINLGSPEGIKIRGQFGLKDDVKEVVRVFVTGEFVNEEKDAEGQRPVMITTNGIDRMGEVVDPKGVNLDNYKKNPVILFGHDYSQPPIGSAKWVRRTDNGIMALPRFASTQFAQEIKTLYDEGHMQAWSIGFIPLEWEDQPVEEAGGRKKPRRIYTKSELLEFSAVPVPANPEALSMAMSKGLVISDDTARALSVPITSNANAEIALPSISSSSPILVHPDDARLKAMEQELAGLKTSLEERDQQIATLTEKLAQLEHPPAPVEPKIRIIASTAPEDAVIRIHGAPEDTADLEQIVSRAVDGRMKRYTGRVS